MLFVRILVLALWLAGCAGPLLSETKFIDPGVHDVQREFALPGAVDLDRAQAAVIAVYARLMLSVEALSTKDGPQFRLINGKMVNLSSADGLNYADCGERQEVKKRQTGVTWRAGPFWKWYALQRLRLQRARWRSTYCCFGLRMVLCCG